jgi:polar amino acid transport system permease protein
MLELFTLLTWGDTGWGDEIAWGVCITIALALSTLPLGLLLGFFLALAKNSSEPTLQLAGNIYTTIFRGLPELLTLFLIYFGGQMALSAVTRWLYGAPIEINSFVAGMIALSLVFSSYASEVFLSAFRGIQSGQYEAASALGLTRFRTMLLIILPQLIRLALPGLSNLLLVLLKDTSLVSVVGLTDLLRATSVATGVTKEAFFFYSLTCCIYLILSIICSVFVGRVSRWAERGQGAH